MPRSTATIRQLVRDFGTCLSLNGTTSQVVCPLWSPSVRPITMAAWFKCSDFTQPNQPIIINGTNTATTGRGYGLYISGNNATDGSVYLLDAFFAWYSLGFKVRDTNWHHIVLTIDNTVATIVYLDGVQKFSGGDASLHTPLANSLIGYDVSGFFKGKIDNPRFYTRALSATEVTNLYYGIEPSTANFVSEYKFNEGSGTTAIDNIGTNTGTITAATYSTDVFMKPRTTATRRLIDRDFGTCIKLGGSTASYIDTGYIPPLIAASSNFSVSAFIAPQRNGGETTDAAIVAARGNDGVGEFLFCYNAQNDPKGKLSLFLNADPSFINFIDVNQTSGTGTGTLNTSPDLRDNQWHHVAMTYTAADNTARLYVDGVMTCAASGFIGTATITSLYIGLQHNESTDKHATGFVDEVVWWDNKVLSLAEIQNIFYLGIYPSNPKSFWYKLDEGSGTTAIDSSGNGRNGTIVSCTYSTNVFMKPRSLAA